MKFPFLASVVIFLFVLHHNLHKSKKINKKQEDSYWKREYEANTTRKKSMEDLEMIPFDAAFLFPLALLSQEEVPLLFERSPKAKEILPGLVSLTNAKIVNLNGISNTDLKFKYGIANFNLLSEYDENYLKLVALLGEYGHCYYKAGFYEQAETIYQYAVSIGSDVSETYHDLCCILRDKNETDQMNQLFDKIKTFPERRQQVIFRKLKESGLYDD